MSAERPTFEAGAPRGSSWTLPESFKKALDDVRPDGLDWKRLEGAMAVLKGEKEAVVPKPPEPEPTEPQKFWRDMYRTGKLSPYQKDRPGITFESVAAAWNDPKTQGVKSKVMAVDLALRGGADKEYNQLGGVAERAARMAVMMGNTVPFTAFDIVTSIPASLVGEYLEIWVKKHEGRLEKDTKQFREGLLTGTKKIIDVQNDKAVTALGDMMVTNLTGEKGGWTHEAADKSADLLQTAFDDYLKDSINGPVLESIARFVYQIPIFGALAEQGWTRLSLRQEKSPLNKGIAKSFYMGIGTFIGVWRDVKSVKNNEKKAPSAWIARKVWSWIMPSKQYNFFEFIDKGKQLSWMRE